jgi:hypothetical protein
MNDKKLQPVPLISVFGLFNRMMYNVRMENDLYEYYKELEEKKRDHLKLEIQELEEKE